MQTTPSFAFFSLALTSVLANPNVKSVVKGEHNQVHAKLLGHVRLWDPTDCSLPGSSVHGILQARTLGWVAMPSSRGFL